MYIFYCKQKTAYEMRISDWSSDVCSSDLLALVQVLVKACGDDRVADHPWLPAILANAGSYALGYEYEDRKKGIQISDEQGTRDRSFHFRVDFDPEAVDGRSEEHTSELQSLMRTSYAVFCLKTKRKKKTSTKTAQHS